MTLKVALGLLQIFRNLLLKKNYNVLIRPLSLSKQFTAAIITLTQMHTSMFVRFLK